MTYQEEIIERQQMPTNLSDMEEGIIRALREGIVPEEGAKRICVGRDIEIEEFKRQLSWIKRGHGVTKFIKGEYKMGKSLLLKVIKETALDDDFVVSEIVLTDVHFNKFEDVHRKIIQNLKSKEGDSFEDIIKKWLTDLRRNSMNETTDPLEQNRIVRDYMKEKLMSVRKHANSFAVAIEKYYEASNRGEDETANFAMAWLKGDSNIPFQYKRRFGVKGDITRESSFLFLKALTAFIKSIGYSGFVVLIDEVELIRTISRKDLRNTSYENILHLYEKSEDFENILFVFAGTGDLFSDANRGIPSYEALYSKIKDALPNNYRDLRKPILQLDGLKRSDLKELSDNVMELHGSVYNWNPKIRINHVLEKILDDFEERATGLAGGKITPREFNKAFMGVLDTVQQNPDELDSNEKILNLFVEKERIEEEILREEEW